MRTKLRCFVFGPAVGVPIDLLLQAWVGTQIETAVGQTFFAALAAHGSVQDFEGGPQDPQLGLAMARGVLLAKVPKVMAPSEVERARWKDFLSRTEKATKAREKDIGYRATRLAHEGRSGAFLGCGTCCGFGYGCGCGCGCGLACCGADFFGAFCPSFFPCCHCGCGSC
jgi:hypothetical protein